MEEATLSVEATGAAKPLGRNQKMALWGYITPWATQLLLLVIGLSTKQLGFEAAFDKMSGFTQVYVPIAMGSILLVAGGIKSITALSKRHQA